MNFDYRKFGKRFYAKFFDDDILSRAAQVAFYFTFSLFPLLLFLITVFGFVLNKSMDFRADLFSYLGQIMPGSAFELVQTTLDEVAESSSGGKLTLGLLVALWTSSSGIDSLRGALNAVYNLDETRSWWKTKLISLLLTVGMGVLIVVALSIIFYGSQALGWVLPIETPWLLQILGGLIILAVLILAFALLYNFLPNHEPMQWKWISPGAIAGIVLWLLFSIGFRVYLEYFDNYAKTYGSLGAVIVLLTWLYLTGLVILVGGTTNAIFDEFSGVKKEHEDKEQTQEEKETAEKPLGDALQKQK